jgi:hypothetical protein
MRILVDYHHPDLYWSFILTMEKRLGWEVYRVIGMEWYDLGYWQFEKFWAGDRFARMFLPLYPEGVKPGPQNPVAIPPGYDRNMGTHWERDDPRHPGHIIKMVTVKQAKAMGFDFVIATVPHNQHGFKKFSQEIGAKFALQVGNAEHFIDWNLNPYVLCSTTAPFPRGVKAVRYDQEIDPAFCYSKIPDNKNVSSFVMDMADQQDLEKFMYVADHADATLQLFGSMGLYLNTVPDVAKEMSDSAIIWHSKKVGDGWGHVIHGAMAVGRPIIGSSRYYVDRVAARLWTPENSIELHGQAKESVAGQLTNLLNDRERLQKMGDASRALWDQYIDYERDAAAIGNLLEG